MKELHKSLLKNRQLQNLSFNPLEIKNDILSNYKFEDFKPIKECIHGEDYSYTCYIAHCWHSRDETVKKEYYLRVTDISANFDNKEFIYICPAYKLDIDMAKVKKIIIPNRLGLTPGKVELDLPEPSTKLDYSNSYYDPKLKRRVPKQIEIKAEPKEKVEKEIKKRESTQKKQPTEDLMLNNKDSKVDGSLYSGDFLPPGVCTRLWTLSKPDTTGWAWFMKEVEGYKTKYEFYCRPKELPEGDTSEYNRGGSFITIAYLKSEYPALDIPELSHDNIRRLSVEIKEKPVESVQLCIDIQLSNYKCELYV